MTVYAQGLPRRGLSNSRAYGAVAFGHSELQANGWSAEVRPSLVNVADHCCSSACLRTPQVTCVNLDCCCLFSLDGHLWEDGASWALVCTVYGLLAWTETLCIYEQPAGYSFSVALFVVFSRCSEQSCTPCCISGPETSGSTIQGVDLHQQQKPAAATGKNLAEQANGHTDLGRQSIAGQQDNQDTCPRRPMFQLHGYRPRWRPERQQTYPQQNGHDDLPIISDPLKRWLAEPSVSDCVACNKSTMCCFFAMNLHLTEGSHTYTRGGSSDCNHTQMRHTPNQDPTVSCCNNSSGQQVNHQVQSVCKVL